MSSQGEVEDSLERLTVYSWPFKVTLHKAVHEKLLVCCYTDYRSTKMLSQKHLSWLSIKFNLTFSLTEKGFKLGGGYDIL